MRGEVGETYWGGACDFFCIFGFGGFRMRVQRRKLLVWWELWEVGDRLRVMRGGWLLNTQVQRRELLLVGWELWEVGEFFHFWGESWVSSETWGRAQRREERWDRGEETKFKKKLINCGSIGRKKLTKRVNDFYEFAIKNVCSVFKITSAHILKHRVQTMIF